jgi:hypothetical protein
MATKFMKWPKNVPNGGKIERLATKYTNTFYVLQDLPKFTHIGIFG